MEQPRIVRTNLSLPLPPQPVPSPVIINLPKILNVAPKDPLIDAVAMTNDEVASFVDSLKRIASKLSTASYGLAYTYILASIAVNRPLNQAIPIWGQKYGITLPKDFDEAILSFVKALYGDAGALYNEDIFSLAYILYFSGGWPVQFNPFNSDDIVEDSYTGKYLTGENNVYVIFTGHDLDNRGRIWPVAKIFASNGDSQSYHPEVEYKDLGTLGQFPRTNRATYKTLFEEKMIVMADIGKAIEPLLKVDITGYLFTIDKAFAALKGGFLDATVTLSDQSKIYNVDRTILGMFSGYFNTAFKTNVGQQVTVDVRFQFEFEAYLKYLSGVTAPLLATDNILNSLAFASLIKDDYLVITLARALRLTIDQLEITLDQARDLLSLLMKIVATRV